MWLVSGALLIAFTSYVALPFGLAWYLPQYAAQHGIGLDVGRVRVEPFASKLKFSGVRVATAGNSSVEWSNVEVRVDLAELASGRVVLDQFHISDAKLDIGDSEVDGIRVLSEIPVALPEEVNIGELVIDDIELPTFSEALGYPTLIDRLRIASLDGIFQPVGAEVEADLSIGNGRSKLHGHLNHDDGGWILNASEIVALDVPLDGLSTLLGTGGSWRGRLDGAGPVRLVYSSINDTFSATTGGRWAIEAPTLGFTHVAISSSRVDWSGAAFVMFSGDTVDALSVDAEVDLREFRMDVADMLGVEATQLTLRVDASRTPELHLEVEGHIPSARFKGRDGVLEAVEVKASQIASLITMTVADEFGIEVERLTSSTLNMNLPADRSVDMEQIELERIIVDSELSLVSAATGAAERVDWRGFAGPQSSGTVTRIAIERIERQENGEIRVGASSAEAVEDRNADAVLRLRDMTLDSSSVSAAGAMAASGVRIGDTWFASDASTLILERLALEGIEQDADGVVGVSSGRARSVDHSYTGKQTIVGTDLEVTDGRMSDRSWEARHIGFGDVDIDTGAATYSIEKLTLADAAGDIARATARHATLEALQLSADGYRVVVDSLLAESPAWHGETWDAQALEVGSAIVDTPHRHRWLTSDLRFTSAETTASGGASAGKATLESLVLTATGDSTTGAQQVVLDGLNFDGEFAVSAKNASAERTYFRASDGLGIDVAGLRADAVEWNGDSLAVGKGAAPLVFLTAAPVRASFDSVGFTSGLLGTGGAREFQTLTSASGRGNVEHVLEWTAGALALNGFHSPAFGEATFESLETRDVRLVGDGNQATVRAKRAIAKGAHIDAPGDTAVESIEIDAITIDEPYGSASTSARALRASPLTIRQSVLEIGELSVSGIDGALGLSEAGDWELPVLPIGTGIERSPIQVRIHEASVAGSGSVIRIMDRSTDPHFVESVRIRTAALRRFDSAAIGVPAHFSVEAAADTFAALQAEGALIPTLTGTDLDLNATVHGLSLREISPYTRLHLGQSVEDGHADAIFDAMIRTSDLEGTADVSLSGVALGDPEPPAGTPALGAALDSLKDEQGRIELKVSLRGEVDSPEFDFDGLMARAIASAALEKATTLPKAE